MGVAHFPTQNLSSQPFSSIYWPMADMAQIDQKTIEPLEAQKVWLY